MMAQPLRTRRDYGSSQGSNMKIENCARCHGIHDSVEFKQLTNPTEDNGYTHWASCPSNGEPILMKFVKTNNGDDMTKEKLATELVKMAKSLIADEVIEGGPYKVDMNIVKNHSNVSQYLGLVRKEIKLGEGTVDVKYVENGMAGIYGTGTHTYFLGTPEVPVAALKKV